VGEDRNEATGGDRRRLTVPEAAEALGVTVDAVRGRIRRGKLEAEHHAGAVYVWVDAPEAADGPRQSSASQRPSTDRAERVEDLREQVAYLREQLDREREARTEERRRQDTIIAQLSAANVEQARVIRAIEAPATREASEDAETVEEDPDASEPRPTPAGPQTAPQRPQSGALRGLRRRLLGW
jgi:hypothetical protein